MPPTGSWVMRPTRHRVSGKGTSGHLADGLTLDPLRRTFSRAAPCLHWPAGAEGVAHCSAGDILTVVSDRRYVSFMYSYPNLIPLPAHKVRTNRRGSRAILAFDRIYGAWWDRVVASDAKAAVRRSAARYVRAVVG